jgi:Reverse transcriptase (RNA-dependent DNA polymerase)
LRRSARHSTPTERLTYEHATDEEYESIGEAMLAKVDKPVTYEDACSGANKFDWKKAIHSEMESLSEKQTWKLVPLSQGNKALKPKRIFKIKPDPVNQKKTLKARLVVRGFEQQYGIDYFETFAPVARIKSIRLMLSVELHKGMFLHQMGVKTAFLNGKLNEEVYMKQPEGCTNMEFLDYVFKLQKAIYGLKQAPRAWYRTIDTNLLSLGLSRSKADLGMYYGKLKMLGY